MLRYTLNLEFDILKNFRGLADALRLALKLATASSSIYQASHIDLNPIQRIHLYYRGFPVCSYRAAEILTYSIQY